MKYMAFLFLMVFSSCLGKEEQKRIRVSGEGKIRVMPNLVTLTLNVAFTKPRMADAVKATQETVDSVLLILEQFGKKDFDIKTSSISANKDYDYNGNTNKFIGYQAQQTIDQDLQPIGRQIVEEILQTLFPRLDH